MTAVGAFRAYQGLPARVAQTAPAPARPARADIAGVGCGSLSVRDFGATGDGITDDTSALQRAIDHVRDQGLARHDTSHLPRLILPSGHYKLTDTIDTLPWIKLCSAGGVLLDFEQMPASRNGIVCRNENMLAAGDLCYPATAHRFSTARPARSPCSDRASRALRAGVLWLAIGKRVTLAKCGTRAVIT